MSTPSRPSTPTAPTTPTAARAARGPGTAALAGGVVFLGAYLANDPVRSAVATRAMPLPTAPPAVLLDYVRGESTALVLPALTHLVSIAGLLLFCLSLRRALAIAAPDEMDGPARWGLRAGAVAVAAMAVSATLSILLAVLPALPDGLTLALHRASFLTGGVAHVVSLGVAALLLGRPFAARGIRILAVVAAVPALLSLVSLVWFYGNAFILLGRLLSMVWILAAGAVLAGTAFPLRPGTRLRSRP